MNCQICQKPTKKPINKFCSIECKSESQKGKREKLDPSKNIQCKLDGKIFQDYLNRGGALTQYSRNILKKEFDWNDWEIIRVAIKETWDCPYCDWKSVDVENVSGWITTHLEKEHDLTPEQHCQQHPNDRKLWKMFWIRNDRLNKINGTS